MTLLMTLLMTLRSVLYTKIRSGFVMYVLFNNFVNFHPIKNILSLKWLKLCQTDQKLLWFSYNTYMCLYWYL